MSYRQSQYSSDFSLTRLGSFCICNEGFTIERCIHGMDAEYNDIII